MFLFLKLGLRLGEGGTEEGVAVAGKDYLPGLQVEGDDAHVAFVDGEAINDAVGLVLLLHGLEHAGDDGLSGGIVVKEMVVGKGAVHDDGSTLVGQFLLVGLGVVEVNGFSGGGSRKREGREECLAVAYHPDFAVQATEDDGAGGEAILRMGLEG